MVSSVKEKDITKLREAGYLAQEIVRRRPAKGQIIPTPEPHERVVFIPHFVRGLGFPLHPFVRGLMFYYGLDFHDMAPSSFLNISTDRAVTQHLGSLHVFQVSYKFCVEKVGNAIGAFEV